jgi:NhaP-type Na+/H+ or K+/H+ antiporter
MMLLLLLCSRKYIDCMCDSVCVLTGLYRTFKAFKGADPTTSTAKLIVQGIGTFTVNSLGSVVFALVCGIVSSIFFKYVTFDHYPVALEITLFIFFAYGPYLLALPYLSGIMCVLISGIVMSYYTAPNLSKQAQQTISGISKTLAFICETFVFIYMGMAVFSFSNLYWDILLIIAVIVLCMIGRFLNITPLSLVVNFYRKERITFKNQFIMWFSGLRGAIAFALSIEFLEEGVEGQFLFTTTLAVVLFTIVVFGGGTYPLLKVFKIKSKDDELNERKTAMMRDSSLHEELVLKINKRFLRNWFMRKEVLSEMRAELKAATEKERQEREAAQRADDQEMGDTRIDMEGRHVQVSLSNPNTTSPDTDPMSLFQSFMADPAKLQASREALQMYDRTFRN